MSTIDPRDIDAYVSRLHDQRSRALHEQLAMVREARTAERDFTTDERAKLDAIDADVARIDADLKAWVGRAASAREADEARAQYEPFVRPDQVERAFDRPDTAEADLMAFLRGERRDVEFDLRAVKREKAALRAGLRGAEFRDMTVATAAAGGDTVPTSFIRSLYDFLEQMGAVRRVATVITTAGGENLDVPKVTAGGTAAIKGEGTAFAEADPALAKVTLGAWKYTQLIQVSSELLADTGVDMLGFLARDAGRALGRITGTDYVTGSGTNKPLGVATACGTGATAAAAGTGIPSYAVLVDLLYSVNDEYRQNGAVWMARDATIAQIRKLVDTAGNPLWQPNLIPGQPETLLGYPVLSDPNVAAMGTASNKSVLFGDFSTYWIRDSGGVRFERSDEFAFSSDLVTFRSALRTDGDLIDLTGSVKAMSGGTS